MYRSLMLALVCIIPAHADEPAPFPSPDPPGRVQPARAWDVEHLHLDVELDIDEGSVSGRTVHTLKPLATPATSVRLHQVGLDVKTVQVDGQSSDFQLGATWIEIPLDAGKPHEVEITYLATPQIGMHFRRPGEDSSSFREAWTQGENEDHRHWFPSWDHPTDRFTLSTEITVDSDLTALANGTLTSKEAGADGKTTWSYRLDQRIVNYLVVIAAGAYQELPHEGARVPIASYIDADLPRSAAGGLDTVVPMLHWFDEVLGTPYAYPQYRQVVVQSFMYGGMENTTTTILADGLLTKEAWDDPRAAERVVAHELAHQWFGDLLTCYGWRELWLNEGFATYWTNRWLEHAHPPEYAALRWQRNLSSARGQRHPMALRSWAAREGDGPNHNVYNRGATVLRMLEGFLGRDTFDAGIQLYVQRHADQLVETADLRRALEDVSGKHLGWLFDQWVYRPGAPDMKVTHSFHAAEEENPATVEVVLTQGDHDPAWIFPVTVEIGTADTSKRRTVWVDRAVTKVVLDVEAPPSWVMADPEQTVIASWDQKQSRDQWMAAMAQAPSWHTRLAAMSALSKLEEGDQLPFIRAAAAWVADPELDRDVRRQAAEALGARVMPESAAALVELRSVEPASVRASVMSALGKQAGDEPRAALRTAAARDEAAQVRAAALTALSTLDEDSALKLARTRLRDAPPVREAALKVLGRHGDIKDLKRILPFLDGARTRGVRSAATREAWELVSRHPDDEGARTRASRAIDMLLDSGDVRMRARAIQALGQIGDAESARRLQAYAANTLLTTHREWALDAARRIRSDERPPPKPPGKDDLERLGERIDAIKKRLDEIEQRP